ncbi:hypothetical protein LWI29_020728 [Acer saccharum]|uniref:Uncharacterized protein n=1 Tax=Acer saccharum TaxID=4024 RepID=A0AA39W8P3_ACESA|nr:hypothetical protein LWI29_020728 [Acer saccharum]
MGCGKSKHDDVATGNTVVTRKKCIINNTDASKKDTETDLTKSLLVEQKEVSHDHKDELNNENGGGGLISKESPNRFFSSRKEDHEESSSIDGFGLEGKSEKSEYLTPRQEAGKESVFFNDKFEKVDVGVEESTTTTTTTTGETKIEVGVSEKIKEENLMEETAAEKEKAKDIETEVLSLSAPATANAEKKNLQNDEKVF